MTQYDHSKYARHTQLVSPLVGESHEASERTELLLLTQSVVELVLRMQWAVELHTGRRRQFLHRSYPTLEVNIGSVAAMHQVLPYLLRPIEHNQM